MRLTDDRFPLACNHRRPPVGVRAQIIALDRGQWITIADADAQTGQFMAGDGERVAQTA